MILKHVALVCGSEDNSDRFYERLLGLNKLNSKILPRELSGQIFNLDSELTIINYADDNIHFEIFIDSRASRDTEKIEHVCLEIEGLEAFLEKCRAMEVDILQIPKGDKLLVLRMSK